MKIKAALLLALIAGALSLTACNYDQLASNYDQLANKVTGSSN